MNEGKAVETISAQKADVWSRWKAGESLHEIGRAHGKPHNCIRCVLLARGACSSRSPALSHSTHLGLRARTFREESLPAHRSAR